MCVCVYEYISYKDRERTSQNSGCGDMKLAKEAQILDKKTSLFRMSQ